MGHPKSGKSTMCAHLESIHRRKVINIADIFDWNKDNLTDAYKLYEAYK
jgi:hypothetical protein